MHQGAVETPRLCASYSGVWLMLSCCAHCPGLIYSLWMPKNKHNSTRSPSCGNVQWVRPLFSCIIFFSAEFSDSLQSLVKVLQQKHSAWRRLHCPQKSLLSQLHYVGRKLCVSHPHSSVCSYYHLEAASEQQYVPHSSPQINRPLKIRRPKDCLACW